MSDSHSDGIRKGKFCAVRKDGKCDCGEDYQKNCTGWTYSFLQGTKIGVNKVHEAHHVLCVASVTEFIAKDKEILPVVRETTWCINRKTNMMAMPLWGHTIKWYCNVDDDDALDDATEAIAKVGKAPPFKNIPMHDYDHNSEEGYKKLDVDTEMEKIAGQIAKSKKKHKAKVKELAGKLNTASGNFKTLLNDRGATRSGGTHAAWKMGCKKPTSKWYLPFSMASTATAEPRTFPTTDDPGKVGKKIISLVKAFIKWG